jgi:hypothetical protein
VSGGIWGYRGSSTKAAPTRERSSPRVRIGGDRLSARRPAQAPPLLTPAASPELLPELTHPTKN